MFEDDYPEKCDEEELCRLGAALGVTRGPEEELALYRIRVVAAWKDDVMVDKAVTLDTPAAPAPMVLGGMKLG